VPRNDIGAVGVYLGPHGNVAQVGICGGGGGGFWDGVAFDRPLLCELGISIEREGARCVHTSLPLAPPQSQWGRLVW